MKKSLLEFFTKDFPVLRKPVIWSYDIIQLKAKIGILMSFGISFWSCNLNFHGASLWSLAPWWWYVFSILAAVIAWRVIIGNNPSAGTPV